MITCDMQPSQPESDGDAIVLMLLSTFNYTRGYCMLSAHLKDSTENMYSPTAHCRIALPMNVSIIKPINDAHPLDNIPWNKDFHYNGQTPADTVSRCKIDIRRTGLTALPVPGPLVIHDNMRFGYRTK